MTCIISIKVYVRRHGTLRQIYRFRYRDCGSMHEDKLIWEKLALKIPWATDMYWCCVCGDTVTPGDGAIWGDEGSSRPICTVNRNLSELLTLGFKYWCLCSAFQFCVLHECIMFKGWGAHPRSLFHGYPWGIIHVQCYFVVWMCWCEWLYELGIVTGVALLFVPFVRQVFFILRFTNPF